MPRKSLPAKIKSLQGYEVILTQTTEEEIKDHIYAVAEKYEDYFDEINMRQNHMLNKVIEENPYAGMSFRKPGVHLDFNDWMGSNPEKYFEMMKVIFQFRHDFAVCMQVFDWEEPEIEFMIEKYGNIGEKEKEFIMFEKMRFKQAHDEWEIKDAVWIQENKLKEAHKSHKSKSEWEIEFKKLEAENGIEFVNRWFPAGIPNDEETCIHCINDAKHKKEAEEHSKKMELEQQRMDEDWQKEKASLKTVREKLTCECCNFSTFSDEVYDLHLDSKEHKRIELLKKTYCKCCELQCRTELDFNIHVQTKKHKYAAGILEKQTEFHCEKCDYKTNLKQHFEKHCATKSHNEKV